MSREPQRLMAIAISPLSNLAMTPPSAVELIHNLHFVGADGRLWPDECQLRLSADRRGLSLAMRNSRISSEAIEVWRLTNGSKADGARPSRLGRRDGFIVVILDRGGEGIESGSSNLTFDLSQLASMAGSIDVTDLRRLGFKIDVQETNVDGMTLAPVVSDQGRDATQPLRPTVHVIPKTSEAGRRANVGRRRKSPATFRRARAQTGFFGSRRELTARIWALHRQQMFPNMAAIARQCDTTADVVRDVIERQEGLQDYLQTGCLMGQANN